MTQINSAGEINNDSGCALYQDESASFADRARDLLSRMTIEERCSQLTFASPAIERLNVNAHNWWNECLHGVGRAGLATVFPQAIAMACTFDPQFIQQIASAISDEARAKHHAFADRGDFGIYKGLTFWTPNINIFRDPRWGRGHETYGECPYLTSRIGVAFVKGLQGDDPKYLKVVATPKHFAVHSGPETGRHSFDAHVTQRDLYETYFPAFKATVTEAKAYSVMGAYNRLEGVPCCANDFLLNQTLRNEWGFEGYTVSDCGAITDIHTNHKVTSTPAESAAMAIKNGLDLCCGSDFAYVNSALQLGLLTEADINRSVYRLLLARFRLGMFDSKKSVSYARINYDVIDSIAHRSLALEAARRSIVLLKNSGRLLPLKKNIREIAVIGPNADCPHAMLGNYHGTPPYIVTALQGIAGKVSPETRVVHIQGTTHLKTQGAWLGTADRGFTEAVIAAERADVSVVCLGLTSLIEGEEGDAMNSDAGGDRVNIELPQMQEVLLKAVIAVGKPVIVVLINGSSTAIPFAADHANAIIQQFYPGQSGGEALADVLFGDHNPSGRLPLTYYKSTSDLPPFNSYVMAGRTYRYFNKPVLYPFGFGLSYTQFEYQSMDLNTESDGTIIASVKLKNIGKLSGHEIVQIYVKHLDAPVPTPNYQLAGMQRVILKPEQIQEIKIVVSQDSLLLTSNDGSRSPSRGKVRITTGGVLPGERSIELGAAKGISQTISLA